MLYQKIDINRLYEQADLESEKQVGEFPTEEENQKILDKQILKGAAYGFPVNQEIYNQLVNLIDSGTGTWMASEPIKPLDSGKDGDAAMLTYGGKTLPVYLMIKLHSDKGSRKAEVLNLEADDRFYVALLTSPDNLMQILKSADGIQNSVRLSVKTPMVKKGQHLEHTIQLWKDFKSTDVDSELNINLEDNPGLAAQLNIPENINENKEEISKLQDIADLLGPSIKVQKWKDGHRIAFKTNDYVAAFYTNGRVLLKRIKDNKVFKGNYEESGRTIKLDGNNKPIKGNNIWSNLRKVIEPEANDSIKNNNTAAPFKTDKDAADFRKWANSTDDLKKKYGEDSEFDLDPIGKANNSFIRKAYNAAKAEYAEFIRRGKQQNIKVEKLPVKNIEAPKVAKSPGIQPVEKPIEDMDSSELELELKKAKEELAAAKASRRDERKSERLRKKIERIERRTNRKSENIGESKVYTFDEFIKSISDIQH